MDLFELLTFFETNGWVQTRFARLEYDKGTRFITLWRRHSNGPWILWFSSMNYNAVVGDFCQYAMTEYCIEGRTTKPYTKEKCRLTNEQEIAIQIIRGDLMATDLAKDIISAKDLLHY